MQCTIMLGRVGLVVCALIACGCHADGVQQSAESVRSVSELATSSPGSAFTVNTRRDGNQQQPAVATDAAGNFVVVWTGSDDGERFTSIFAQRFDGGGQPLGESFRINEFAKNLQLSADVAMDVAGNFVVVWASNAQDGPGISIRGRRFNADGSPRGDDFRISESARQTLPQPQVAMQASGDFVVTWTESTSLIVGGARLSFIVARRYTADGTPRGAPFDVTVASLNKASFPAVALADDGSFVVTWTNDRAAGLVSEVLEAGAGIFFRRFGPDGRAQGLARRVDFPADGSITDFPAISRDPARGFVIVWQSLDARTRATRGIFARRYMPSGQPVGDAFQVGDAERLQRAPRVALRADGKLLVAATSTQGIHLQACTVPCDNAGPPLRVDSSSTPANEFAPDMVLLDDHLLLLAWQHQTGGAEDRDVMARLLHLD